MGTSWGGWSRPLPHLLAHSLARLFSGHGLDCCTHPPASNWPSSKPTHHHHHHHVPIDTPAIFIFVIFFLEAHPCKTNHLMFFGHFPPLSPTFLRGFRFCVGEVVFSLFSPHPLFSPLTLWKQWVAFFFFLARQLRNLVSEEQSVSLISAAHLCKDMATGAFW